MRGFTLVELLIVLGVLAIVSALAIPFIQSFQISSDLYTFSDTIVKTLRRAQSQAIAGQQNSDWGVYFDTGASRFILFKGNNFLTRDSDYDQIENYPAILSVSNNFGDEINFSVYSGIPSASSTITVISSGQGAQIISINSYGKIESHN